MYRLRMVEVRCMAYGLTYATQDRLSEQLAERLKVPADKIRTALTDITKEEVARIAKNKPG